MGDQLALLPDYLGGHVRLTLAALVLGIAVSVPAGIAASRRPGLSRAVIAVASVIQTIPALALLAIMVPLLAALDVTSIGYLPAGIGLVLYSMLPILQNTITGLAGVDPMYREAARGVGMTDTQQLRRVELPLALPVIVAGIRTSAVATVGMATLSTPVGAPSLGNYIFTGLQTRNLTAILVGCAAAALLALGIDAVLSGFGRQLDRRRRGSLGPAAVAAGVAVLVVVGLSVGSPGWRGRADQPVRIGAKTFTEQYILADLLAQWVTARTGAPTDVRPSLGSTVAFDALAASDIDVYVDYTGTVWTTILRRTDSPGRERLAAELAAAVEERFGVRVAARLGFENAYAFAMRRTDAARRGVRRLSDLGPVSPRLSLGTDYEFLSRPEWRSAQRAYDLRFRAERSMDPSLMYQAAAAGQVDVISAFSTDGRIEAFDLVTLDDDRQAIPPYDAVVLVSPRLVRDRPDVVAALEDLEETIPVDAMRAMNLAVDQEGRLPGAVAREFLAGLPANVSAR